MTMTLMAELFILTLGTQMDTALIKEFCMFTKVALCVDYLLEMTFVIAVLSIDIKRVEVRKVIFRIFFWQALKSIIINTQIISWLIWMTVKCQKDYMN